MTYLVANEVGGFMESPNTYYINAKRIKVKSKKEAAEKHI